MDATSLITILGMGAATYLTRILGFFIAGRLNLTPRFRYALSGMPIAILVSIAVPQITNGTWAEALASLAVIVAAATGRGLLFCMASGIIAVDILRYVF